MTHKIPASLIHYERLGERYAILKLRPEGKSWAHKPGQYTEIQFGEGDAAFSKIYSIATASQDSLEFCIQMNDARLLEAAKQWQSGQGLFQIKAAAGNFYNPPHETSVVLIAGGSGVTPLKAIFEDRITHDSSLSTTLLYGCGDDKEIPFFTELRKWELDSKGRAKVRFFAEHIVDQAGGRAELGRPLNVLNEYVDFAAEYLMCGPPPFMEATRAALIKAGVSPLQIHQDKY